MAGHIASFSGALRAAGIPSHARAVLDACRAAALVDLGDRDQFYWALRANFVNDPSQFGAFDRTFQLFWDQAPSPPDAPPEGEKPELPSTVPSGNASGQTSVPNPPASGGASAQELLVRKDLRALTPDEEPALAAVLRELLAKLTTRPGRRERPSFHGRRLEFRRIFRENTKYGGELLELWRREKKPAKRRLAFLGDVSGSMDVYSRFFLMVAFALARQEPDTEIFAFSTRLFRLTDYVKAHHGRRTVARALEDTRGWSGGTKIGECLKGFNDALARKPHLRDTVVVILSDGWDRGDPGLLRRELVRLKNATAKVYWLNPLKGDPEYKPLCRGMATALPYLDGFHAAHNVETLARFAKELVRVR